MAIELSTITFTDQDDIFPLSGVERILNTGIANTLAGNDTIIGTGDTNKPGACHFCDEYKYWLTHHDLFADHQYNRE